MDKDEHASIIWHGKHLYFITFILTTSSDAIRLISSPKNTVNMVMMVLSFNQTP